MNGCDWRGLAACSARAKHSLPEPVGPWINTDSVELAMRDALRASSAIWGSLPARSANVRVCGGRLTVGFAAALDVIVGVTLRVGGSSIGVCACGAPPR